MIKLRQKTTTIGWIGTGVMGSSMCLHLIKKG
ncbi:MAG: NAD(P)-dependent oxidoreductase, partial [Deltaproteobacteria bacterium]|nr:NAD(P)-dependent oxidoreductase [Deltaproteobacteria bacterium]